MYLYELSASRHQCCYVDIYYLAYRVHKLWHHRVLRLNIIIFLPQIKNVATPSCGCVNISIELQLKFHFLLSINIKNVLVPNTLSHLLDLQEMFHTLIWPLVNIQIKLFPNCLPYCKNSAAKSVSGP